MNLQIIGLTGSFGSGCSYVANNILSAISYQTISLSDILQKQYRSEKNFTGDIIPRQDLQEYGDLVRKNKGAGYLAEQAYEEIQHRTNIHSGSDAKWVVDSIRNPAEIHFLRKQSQNFYVFGIYATMEKRWDRVKEKYDSNLKNFAEDDERDTGRDSPEHGQRVEDCFAESDVVIPNEENFKTVANAPFNGFRGRIENLVKVVSNPLTSRQPTQAESLMAAAYTMSQRSSCLKRKVGAVIVDDKGDIISSGFNEVPRHSRPCVEEFGKCARRVDLDKFFNLVKDEYPDLGDKHESLRNRFSKEFKNLDICRALHAEENAIVNLARSGRSVPLDQCTLYTTTYPCRLCANKIVNLGIRRVIYLEPYPDQEAKVIFKNAGIEDQFFEGITFKAYSRVYGEMK